jgi:L-ascorbate metabolism protein UlaG (beta-lactamase superfamily)
VKLQLADFLEEPTPPQKVALMRFDSFSGIAIKTPSTRIMIDPVGIKPAQFKVDAIVVTHEHYDHLDTELVTALQHQTGAPVITTPFVARHLKLAEGKVRVMRIGDCLSINNARFLAEYCEHPAGEALSFIITTEDGITIFHPDDSEPFPAMATLGSQYRPDILLYLADSPNAAAQIAKLIGPKIVLSCFHDEISSTDFGACLRMELPGIKAGVLKRLEPYCYPPRPNG